MSEPRTFGTPLRIIDPSAPESISARVRRLQTEAASLASEHIAELQSAMAAVVRISAEIEGGGEAYAVGVRQLCEKLGPDMVAKMQTVETIMGRRK